MRTLDRNAWKTPVGTAVIAAFLSGVVAHLFVLVMPIHNYDDIISMPGGFGGGLSMGRWFLELIGRIVEKLGLNYNLPTLNGLFFLALLAVSAGVVVSFLEIKNRVSAAMAGMLFVVFPSVAGTLFFRFTAPLYGVGVLLAVLSAWILRRSKRFGLLLSVLFGALSIGIYQAYIPMTISMFVLSLIARGLDGETSVKELIRQGLYDCLAIALGTALYFLCEKCVEAVFDVSLGDYKGLDTIGQISLKELPGLIVLAFDIFIGIPFQDFCGVAIRKIQKLTYLYLGGVTIGMIGYILAVRVRSVLKAAAVAVLCLLFPIAVNFIVVMTRNDGIYTLMVYAFVFVGLATLVFAEKLPQRAGERGKKISAFFTRAVAVGVALLIFGYTYYNNTNYMAIYYGNRQIENYVNGITIQVRMTEGFTPDMEWAFLGEIDDPLLDCEWEEEANYSGSGFTTYLLNQYSRASWFRNYIGYKLPLVSEEQNQALAEKDVVKAMPCWPAEGSIAIVDNTVVVKFQELAR